MAVVNSIWATMGMDAGFGDLLIQAIGNQYIQA